MAKIVKAAFTDELEDIDDLLPSLPPRRKAPTDESATDADPSPDKPTETSHDATPGGGQGTGSPRGDRGTEQTHAAAPAPAPGKSPTPTRAPRTVKEPSETTGAPTADISSTNLKNLRALTNSEKARNPITARTYGAVVLDAIEAHEEELKTHWRQPAAQTGATSGLFKRQPVVSKRRRHAEPPAQITLQGLGEENAALLEELWDNWGAPSRSAFVDQALTLYLKPKSRRKAAGE